MKKILILVAALMVMNMPSVHANIPVEQDVFVANARDQFALPTSYRVAQPVANQGNVSAIHQEMGWLGLKLVLILIILVNSFLFLKERRRHESHEKNSSL